MDEETARAAAAGQQVEWVDENGAVLGVVTRAEMRSSNLLHRAVFVVVFRSSGEVLVHQRAAWKDVWPSFWDLAVGGVLEVGEEWSDAARREAFEEVGIPAVELVELGAFVHRDESVSEFARCYRTVWDGSVSLNDGEVTAIDWVSVASLPSWAGERAVVPDSLHHVLPLLL